MKFECLLFVLFYVLSMLIGISTVGLVYFVFAEMSKPQPVPVVLTNQVGIVSKN